MQDALQKWTVAIVIFLGAVNPQMPMMPVGFGYGGPMMMPPPPAPMPVPMPVPVPVGIPIPYPESTSTTTTTTTESNNGNGENGDNRIPIAIPIPVPHFVQIAIPGFLSANCFPKDKNNGRGKGNGNGDRNKNCPPCPPCSCNPCTPSFFSFCSPCHLECRCKNGKENPSPREPNPPKPFSGPAFPMPIPMPAPGPVVIVPFPGHFGSQPPWKKPPRDSSRESRPASDSCEDSKSHDSCDSSKSSRKKKRRKGKGKGRNRKRKSNYDIKRRSFAYRRNRSDKRDGLVEPVLTYMSRNGDIKIQRRLSNVEAHALLEEREPFGGMEPYNRARDTNAYSNVHLTAGEDLNNKPRVLVRSEPGLRNDRHRGQEFLVSRAEHVLGEGKKELMFKTPDNKKISNLSVTFQITK